MQTEVLVVGAGPVGLSAALFLNAQNRKVEVVEKLLQPVLQSKALAVNPRTLELLESTGVTEKMLQRGQKIFGACLWRDDGKLVGELEFSHLHARFPFMLALSQASSESLMAEALIERGVSVERGLELSTFKEGTSETNVCFTNGEQKSARYILAADGSHSRVRDLLEIPFEGNSFPGEWFLVDVALRTKLAPDRAHVFFKEGRGFYFLVRVIDDIRKSGTGDPIWRVMSSEGNPLADFKHGVATADPLWSSHFHVSHRICRQLAKGAVFLAGDAAHLHSPAGARGMNLGIEDAWTFAHLLQQERLQEYSERRRTVDKSVVKRVDMLSRVAMGDHIYLRWLREFFLPKAIRIPAMQGILSRAMSGLDHNVEF